MFCVVFFSSFLSEGDKLCDIIVIRSYFQVGHDRHSYTSSARFFFHFAEEYRGENKGLYMVARNFFLLLLNCSAWVLLSKTYKPLFAPLHNQVSCLAGGTLSGLESVAFDFVLQIRSCMNDLDAKFVSINRSQNAGAVVIPSHDSNSRQHDLHK